MAKLCNNMMLAATMAVVALAGCSSNDSGLEPGRTTVVVDAYPTAYADEPRLHAALTHLRAHAPVSLVDHPPYRPFWAITRHADIMAIEHDNALWVNEPRSVLAPAAADDGSHIAVTTVSGRPRMWGRW